MPNLKLPKERISRTSNRKQDRKSTLRLPRKVKAALTDFQHRLLELFPDDISQLILYGSYARGEAMPDSDVDVMVVVKWADPERTGGYYLDNIADPRWQTILDEAVQAMIDHGGPFISPLVIGDQLFSAHLPVADDARREGIVSWKSQPSRTDSSRCRSFHRQDERDSRNARSR